MCVYNHRFQLECDEDRGLHFQCPASLLLERNGDVSIDVPSFITGRNDDLRIVSTFKPALAHTSDHAYL